MDASGHEGSLVRNKVYAITKPEPGDRPSDLRVVDEEGESYLYDRRRFAPISVPASVRRALTPA